MIKLSNVHKSFGNHEVLKGINLDVHEGEKLVIIGPSGSGKSTTVRCMNGLEMPTSGQVFVDDVELTRKNRINLVRSTSSMVFQQFNLYPHLTVMGNLTLAPIKLFGKSRKEAQELARHYLAVVGLEERPSPIPPRSPAVSSSAWPSPAPCAVRPRSSSSTNRPPRLILKPCRKC